MHRAYGVARAALVCIGCLITAGLVSLWRPSVEAQVNRGVPLQCVVEVSTATTLTAVGGQCLARPAPNAIYITDILFSTNASSIAADSFNTLKYGTGANCGTGTTILWPAFSVAAATSATIQSFQSPLRVPPGNGLCWINSTAGSKTLVITGYEAP